MNDLYERFLLGLVAFGAFFAMVCVGLSFIIEAVAQLMGKCG